MKTALVTGASRGIGLGLTTKLRESGYTAIGLSRTNPCPSAHSWIQCDLADASAINKVVADLKSRDIIVDVLVNCAGVCSYSTVSQTTNEVWHNTMTVNVTGAFLLTRAFLPDMMARRTGRIVNIASIAARRGEPEMAAYSVSKHGLLGLTKASALEAARCGVTVNAVCPGPVETDMFEAGVNEWSRLSGRSPDLAKKILKSSNPQGRMIEIEEICHVVSFLISEHAKGVNGQAINVCGGAIST